MKQNANLSEQQYDDVIIAYKKQIDNTARKEEEAERLIQQCYYQMATVCVEKDAEILRLQKDNMALVLKYAELRAPVDRLPESTAQEDTGPSPSRPLPSTGSEELENLAPEPVSSETEDSNTATPGQGPPGAILPQGTLNGTVDAVVPAQPPLHSSNETSATNETGDTLDTEDGRNVCSECSSPATSISDEERVILENQIYFWTKKSGDCGRQLARLTKTFEVKEERVEDLCSQLEHAREKEEKLIKEKENLQQELEKLKAPVGE